MTTTNEPKSSSKIFIYCPFSEKDEARALGAKWDVQNKKWYAPNDAIYGKLKKWHKKPDSKKPYDRPKPAQPPIKPSVQAPARGESQREWESTGETESEYRARQACGSYYKGVWGGVPSVSQYRAMKQGKPVMSTAYDTRGD